MTSAGIEQRKEQMELVKNSRRNFLKQSIVGALALGTTGIQLANANAEEATGIIAGGDLFRRLIVERIETTKVVVPMKPGSISSKKFMLDGTDNMSTFDQLPKHIIQVYSDSGLVGLGESRQYTSRENWFDGALAENVQFLKGRSFLDLNPGISGFGLPRPEASGPFEIAYYDLLGKASGLPVHTLLGGRKQDRIAVTYWTGRRTIEEAPIIAERALSLGFNHLKMKARLGDLVVPQLRAIREVAPDMGLTVDFNSSYANALEFLPLAKKLAEFDNLTIEDPVPPTVDSFSELRGKVDLQLALTPSDGSQMQTAIEQRVCEIFNIGGGGDTIQHFVSNAYLAEVAGCRVWHGSGIDLGVREMAYVHAVAATHSCTLPSDFVSYLRESDLLVQIPKIVRGYMEVPRSPGLGIELDEDKLRFYAVD